MADVKDKINGRAILVAALVAGIVIMLLMLRSCGREETVVETPAPAAKAPTAAAPEPEIPEPAPEPPKKPAPKPEKPPEVKPRPAPPAPAEEEIMPAEPEPEPEPEIEPAPVYERPVVEPEPPSIDELDEAAWRDARRTNTEVSYRGYLSRFPDGRHSREANEIITSGMYPAGKNSKGMEEFRNSKTGTLFVLVPAGKFWMGSPKGEGEPDEHPRHEVYVDAYYIGKYEVTIEQYERFCKETRHSVPEKPWLTEQGDHPIVYPTWEDAKAYCDWAGLRLPTEAEWEKAARGGTDTTYYWGDKPARDMANFLGTGGKDKFSITSPVGSFPPNEYGIHDMAGNIWEWCADWYKKDYYEHEMVDGLVKNPRGPKRGEFKVIRGGSWNYEMENMRPAFRTRLEPKHWYDYNGFRAARSYMPE